MKRLDGKFSIERQIVLEAQPCPAPLSRDADAYVAWLRWSGDEQHRHLTVCDSDAEGAFKVYR